MGTKLLKNSVLLIVSFFIFSGCEDLSTTGRIREKYKYPKELWGEWIRMDTGDTWYFASNYTKNNYYGSDKVTFYRESPNVIKVTDNNKVFYLYASRIPNGTFTGTVVNGRDTAPRAAARSGAMSGIGNAGVAISNLHDKANEVTAKTGADGKFTAEGTIPGDSYEVTVEGQTVVVTPNTNGEDIGTVTVAEGVNFKTSIVPDQSNVDMMFLISGKEYKFNIEVANMGTIDCTAATFSLDFPSGITVKNQPSSLILGTIEPGKKKTIPITISCNSLSSEYEYKKIDVAITDGIALKTWDDAVSIKFNRGSVKFTIYSQKDVSGIIIVPGAKAYSFLTTYSSGLYKTAVELPRYSNEEYLVVFSGASAETETAYSLGIDDTSVPDFDDFSATGIYEPDNTEGEATPLNYGGRITAYLHKNDIDYYTVELSH